MNSNKLLNLRNQSTEIFISESHETAPPHHVRISNGVCPSPIKLTLYIRVYSIIELWLEQVKYDNNIVI